MKSTYLIVFLAIVVMILSMALVAQNSNSNKNKKEHFGSWIKQSGIDGAVYSDPVGMDGAVIY